ncbi:unnamed protein product [Adineta ricciae]|uniref:Uncharacterized protein n=1 Tax=Adineta ricciae TaxID=249248 RepID=A0A816FLS7_ADIRI|nr:unnamed protein product [Adineta ricciae]
MLSFIFISVLFTCVKLSSTNDTILMANPTIYWGETFVPSASSSLLEIRQHFLASSPQITDCALVCLQSPRCFIAAFDSPAKTCSLYNEILADGGHLAAAASSQSATISISKSSALFLQGPNDNIYPVWNTTAGHDSTVSLPGPQMGGYFSSGSPKYLFDGDLTTDVDLYTPCNQSFYDPQCVEGTGVYAVSYRGAFVLDSFRVGTGHYYSSDRDPITMTIEGSNATNLTSLTLGSSWTLLYNGSTGLTIPPGKYSLGVKQTLVNNSAAFRSYRFLVVSKRNAESATEISEIQVFAR